MSTTVLVTGSSRGIGKETTIYFAQNGFDIVLHCNKNKEKMIKGQNEILKIVDDNCGDLDYIIQTPRNIETEFVMSNNFAFGGVNTSPILKRID